MVTILADTHKIIATKMYEDIYNIYNIKLNKDALLWGSVLPDIVPNYRFYRHYKKESLRFISNEIVKLIFISRFIDFDSYIEPIKIKLLSRKLGIISHYLSDFVCRPHAERWTFTTNMFKHINYEIKLNEYAPNHDFKKNIIQTPDIDIYQDRKIKLRHLIEKYIENVIHEYSRGAGYDYDLNYALSLSLRVSYFVLDTINAYSESTAENLIFEF